MRAPKKYRKKPVAVEAIQFDGANTKECCLFIGESNLNLCVPGEAIWIRTPKGTMRTSPGDYIIREPFPTDDRQFYPCKGDIFQQTYEEVVDDE